MISLNFFLQVLFTNWHSFRDTLVRRCFSFEEFVDVITEPRILFNDMIE